MPAPTTTSDRYQPAGRHRDGHDGAVLPRRSVLGDVPNLLGLGIAYRSAKHVRTSSLHGRLYDDGRLDRNYLHEKQRQCVWDGGVSEHGRISVPNHELLVCVGLDRLPFDVSAASGRGGGSRRRQLERLLRHGRGAKDQHGWIYHLWVGGRFHAHLAVHVPGNFSKRASRVSRRISRPRAPTPYNAGGTDPMAVLEWPTAQSTYYADWNFKLPSGYTSNANISYSMDTRCNPGTCDSTHAAILTPYWACSSTGAVDAPSWTAVSTVNITNSSAATITTTTGTIAPTCAAGNRAYVKFKIDTNTNSLTGPFDLVSATFSVQGGM